MIARQALADVLATVLPADVLVIPYADQIDPPQQSTVMLRLDNVSPGASLGMGAYTFALILIAGTTSAGAGDDELEALLEDVLHAITKPSVTGAITWDPPATRGIYADSNPSFQVNVTVTFSRE